MAVDDQMHAFPGRDSIKREVEVLAAPGERRVIRGGEVDAHHPKERMQEPLRLAEWQVEEKTERQWRFDGHVRVLPLPSPSAGARGFDTAAEGATAGSRGYAPRRRAMSIRWTSDVPSPISFTLTSRQYRATG